VKNRKPTVRQVSNKARTARAGNVTEVLFIVAGGVKGEDAAEVAGIVDRQFASGHSIYVFSLTDFASGILALVGEDGRRAFIAAVGQELEAWVAPISDRRAWASLLADL
jgi:hypothetical protein